jgi:hypothetical protein
MSPLESLISPSGLLDLAVKSAAVMFLGVVAAQVLGRASAAWRHLAWCISVLSLLLLPGLSLALPDWRVAWLPDWAGEQTPFAAAGPSRVAQADPITTVGKLDTAGIETQPLDAGPTTSALSPSFATPARTARDPQHVAAGEPASRGRGPLRWLPLTWVAGVLLSLVPLAVGLGLLAALHRQSRVNDDPRWLTLLGELRRQLAVGRGVHLRTCVGPRVPLT